MADELNKRVQFPRNTTSKNDQYTGPPGQVVVDNLRNEMRLHDGRKKGGWRFPNLDQLKRLFVSADSEMGDVTFPSELRGFMARTNNKTYRLRTLTGDQGITIVNGTGAAGDPVITLPDRLTDVATLQTDLNGILESGFYCCDKNATGMPGALAAVAHAALTVHAATNVGDGLMVLQTAISLNTAVNTIYRRRYLAGVWGAWA